MISDLLLMNGYGIYVWSSFAFTLVGFLSLYFIISLQLKKEQKRFEKISQCYQMKNITLRLIKRFIKKF